MLHSGSKQRPACLCAPLHTVGSLQQGAAVEAGLLLHCRGCLMVSCRARCLRLQGLCDGILQSQVSMTGKDYDTSHVTYVCPCTELSSSCLMLCIRGGTGWSVTATALLFVAAPVHMLQLVLHQRCMLPSGQCIWVSCVSGALKCKGLSNKLWAVL